VEDPSFVGASSVGLCAVELRVGAHERSLAKSDIRFREARIAVMRRGQIRRTNERRQCLLVCSIGRVLAGVLRDLFQDDRIDEILAVRAGG
jgi:hypothetical protein